MVDRIPTSNTSNTISQVSTIGAQTRPQTTQVNNQNTTQNTAQSSTQNSTQTNTQNTNNAATNAQAASSNTSTNTARANNNAATVAAIVDSIRQLPANQTVAAQVTSSQALNNSQQALLQRLNPNVAQQLPSNQSTVTSSSDRAPAAPLFLTKLAVSIPVALNTLIDTKTITAITTQAFSTNQTVLLGQQNGQLLINPNNSQTLNLQQQLQQAASQTIKNILPRQESVSQLQQFSTQFSQTIKQLPGALQTKIANTQIIQTVNQLNRFTQTNHSLQQGRQVQGALLNSGTTFEAKLAHSANVTTNGTNNAITSPLTIKNDIRTTLDKALTLINTSEVTARLNPQANALTQIDLEKIITAVLTAQNTSTQAAPQLPAAEAPKNLAAATAAVFRLLGIQVPVDAQAGRQLPRVIEQHFKKLIEQTQAKIQFNQLRSVGLDQSSSETRNNLQQFHTELPLRFNDQVLPLQLSIQEQEPAKEKYQDDAADTEKDDKEKTIRQWQVFLSFDLPDDEKLHTQLTIVESSISATLWAESSTLCHKAQQDISWLRDKLLANGLTVEDITCLQGKPLKKETSLDYNLVDIKT